MEILLHFAFAKYFEKYFLQAFVKSLKAFWRIQNTCPKYSLKYFSKVSYTTFCRQYDFNAAQDVEVWRLAYDYEKNVTFRKINNRLVTPT